MARGGAEAGQRERDRLASGPPLRVSESERSPPPPNWGWVWLTCGGVGGEKDDPYGLIALIKIKWTNSLPSGEGGGRAGWAARGATVAAARS